ncbi:hypothetical protein T439DRAFT_382271 [Meredithblackwellia eburnea MCA 4105]
MSEKSGRPTRSKAGGGATHSSSSSSSSTRGASAGARQSRRRSIDPYQRPEGSDDPQLPSSDPVAPLETMEEESTPVASASGSRSATRREQGPRTSEERQSSEGDRSRPSSRSAIFKLEVLQQPSVGAEVGPDRLALGRLPIVPSPVVQVTATDHEGNPVEIDLPYLFCSCILRGEDGTTPVEVTPIPSGTTGSQSVATQSILLGNLVRTAHNVEDLDGNLMSVFVFEDVCVRTRGRYTLEFRLDEARPKSPRMAAVVSDPFDVVPWDEYPGRPLDSILTPLSRHLHEHSIPMYIPALALIEPGDPPPPGSNPFTGPLPPDLLSSSRGPRRGE